MTHPEEALIAVYATHDDALAAWVQMFDNDDFIVCACVIGFGNFKPAEEPCCYIIRPKDKL